MLIVCAGRSRSGSTLLYNLVRLTLVELFGKENIYGRGISFYKRKHERKYNIVKLHDSDDKYFEINADCVFSCERNEEDQRKSILKHVEIIKNKKMNKKGLDRFIKYDYSRYKKWSGHKNSVKTFKYNTLVNNKELIIKEVSKIFKLNISSDSITNIINEINNMKLPSKKDKRDPETSLTWHHITSEK